MNEESIFADALQARATPTSGRRISTRPARQRGAAGPGRGAAARPAATPARSSNHPPAGLMADGRRCRRWRRHAQESAGHAACCRFWRPATSPAASASSSAKRRVRNHRSRRPGRHGGRAAGVRYQAQPRRGGEGDGPGAGGQSRRRSSGSSARPQTAAAVHHDHVVTIHAVDDSHRPPYLVMQFVEGQTLQQKIDREGALELKQILRIGSQMAAGLAAAHKHGPDPPRREAGQHPARKRRRAGEDHRLRPGPRGRRRGDDANRHDRRHAAVHVARAGQGRADRRPQRPVQPGQRALHDVHRPPGLPRRQPRWPCSAASATTRRGRSAR